MSDANPQVIMQLLQGSQVTGVLAAGIELGVFGALAKGPANADAVAKAIGAPARSTGILLDALAVVGLVTKKGETYANSPTAETHLVPGKPMYMGDVANIFVSPMMWGAFSRLADSVRNDGTVMPEHAETPKHPFWETFARSSAAFAAPGAHAVAESLRPWIEARSGTVRALDVAAGSGLYGLTLAKTYPRVDVTLLDWPNVLVETKKWASRTGADAARVHYLEGNLFEVPFGGPYDVVLLSHVFHHFDDATCASLFKKAAGAVNPGGRVVVQDFFYDAALGNPMGAMFRVTMLSWTRKGTTYTEADYRRWAKGAGLETVDVRPSEGMPASILVAERR